MTDKDYKFNKNYGVEDLELFGLKDIQMRKEYFRQKAARLQKEADEFKGLADRLDLYKTKALLTMTQMARQGKKRLDGKTAKALETRGIADDCGLELAATRLHCTNDVVQLLDVHWADAWFVDAVNTMKDTGVPAMTRSRFYSTLEAHKGNPEGMEAEAGLIILGNV